MRVTVDSRDLWPHPWAKFLSEGWEVERGRLEKSGDVALSACRKARPSGQQCRVDCYELPNISVKIPRSISDPQQLLPLAEVALETHALGYLTKYLRLTQGSPPRAGKHLHDDPGEPRWKTLPEP